MVPPTCRKKASPTDGNNRQEWNCASSPKSGSHQKGSNSPKNGPTGRLSTLALGQKPVAAPTCTDTVGGPQHLKKKWSKNLPWEEMYSCVKSRNALTAPEKYLVAAKKWRFGGPGSRGRISGTHCAWRFRRRLIFAVLRKCFPAANRLREWRAASVRH